MKPTKENIEKLRASITLEAKSKALGDFYKEGDWNPNYNVPMTLTIQELRELDVVFFYALRGLERTKNKEIAK